MIHQIKANRNPRAHVSCSRKAAHEPRASGLLTASPLRSFSSKSCCIFSLICLRLLCRDPAGRRLLVLIGQRLQLVLILLQHLQGFLLLYGELLA